MTHRQFALLTVLLVGAAAVVAVYTGDTREQQDTAGQVAGITTDSQQPVELQDASEAAPNEETQEPNAETPLDSPDPATQQESEDPAGIFQDAYLAVFTGKARPPAVETFSREDNIVLVIILKEGIDPQGEMTTQIYKGDKLIETQPPLEILNGEVGLGNPGQAGSYAVRIVVAGETVYELPFRIL